MTYRKSGDRLMPKSQVEVCVLCCCTPQIHHRVISCSLCEDTVFLCVGDSLEKTTWGLRKREAGKLEDRGCAPPYNLSSLSLANATTQASLTSQEVNLCKGVRSRCRSVMLPSSAAAGVGTGVYQESHTSQVLPKECRQKMTKKRKLRSGLQLN